MKETESIISYLAQMTSLGPYMYTGEFYQTFKEDTKILYNLSQKIEVEEILSNSFYKDSTILIPKSDKDMTRKENDRPIILTNINANILKEILAIQIQQCIKRATHHDQVVFSLFNIFNLCMQG